MYIYIYSIYSNFQNIQNTTEVSTSDSYLDIVLKMEANDKLETQGYGTQIYTVH
jgi:hypothetical protein